MRLLIIISVCLSIGCDETNDTQDSAIFLEDRNNYTFYGNLNIPVVETASAQDLDIQWQEVTSDIQCHTLNPLQDLHNLSMVRFTHITHQQVQEKLSQGEMPQSAMAGYADFNLDGLTSSAKLSELTLFGTPIDIQKEYVANDSTVYLLLLTTGTTPGVGARMLTFIHPTATSTNTTVNIREGCDVLDFNAELAGATPLDIPREPPWIINWGNLGSDGQGNPLVFENIDGVLLGFYQGMSVSELSAQLLDLKLIHSELYEMTLTGGTQADLALATNGTQRFTGFTDNGVWLLGLTCSRCQNPAPLFLTILNPLSGTGQ